MILAEVMLLLTILMKTQAKTRKKQTALEGNTQKQSRGTGKKGQLKTCP